MSNQTSPDNPHVPRQGIHFTFKSLRWFKSTIEFISSIIVIAGVPLFFYQRHEENHRAQVERAINYSLQLYGGELASARLDLLRPWMAYDLSQLKGSVMTPTSFQKFARDLTLTNPATVPALIKLVGHYDGVWLCVEARACDEATALRLFGPYATQMLVLYAPVINDIRTNLQNETFAIGVSSFANLYHKSPKPSVP